METIKSALENIIIFITKVTVMKNKSTILIVIAAIVLGFGIYGSTSFIGSKEVKGPTEKEEKEVVTEPVTTAAEGVGEEENGESEVETASAVKTEFPLEMAEEEIQNTIHAMSHSKVYAVEKWTHLEPNQERIDRLLDVIESNQDGLNESDLYMEILKRWQAGDFSQAVSDHNEIWKLQGGTIGEATRLLSKEEEGEYRKTNFE